jgi:hypothetical protein
MKIPLLAASSKPLVYNLQNKDNYLSLGQPGIIFSYTEFQWKNGKNEYIAAAVDLPGDSGPSGTLPWNRRKKSFKTFHRKSRN